MKKRLAKAVGLICYIILLGLLFRLDLGMILRPIPFVSVLLGMLILTACQYRRQMTREAVIVALRWNLILASFMTTLISFFSSGDGSIAELRNLRLTEHLLPLLYGSVIYILLGILLDVGPKQKTDVDSTEPQMLTATEKAEKVFRAFELTRRECHVAQKILVDLSNKEIAADLYISEATVKKHIQNIYQKLGATDRKTFRERYFEQAGKS